MIRLALFASGAGSNVYNIIQHFSHNQNIEVSAVLSNKEEAGALNHAKNAGIDTLVFDKNDFTNTNKVYSYLSEKNIDFIVLAGFLWKVPSSLIENYVGKIINVHPALLPSYGGKGMYGMNVHKTVVEAKESESGITIHQVNENYDEGAIIARFTCELEKDESPESLAQKIHKLEKMHFPSTIEEYINSKD